MASQINPSTIDVNYPVPGVNQSSSQFRVNWLSIQNNFSEAAAEITDLINKVVVSAPLTYGNSGNVNNFGGMNNANLAIYDYALGSLTAAANVISTNNTLTLDFSKASYFPLDLTTASSVQTLNVTNFTALGYSEVVLDITAAASPQYINLATLTGSSTITSLGGSNVAGFNAATANLAITQAGRYQFTLGSLDGTNFVLGNRGGTSVVRHYTPANSHGALGDTAGQIAYDGSYVYTCIANYDGSTNIWYRMAIGSTF